jgi:hypothetical protein
MMDPTKARSERLVDYVDALWVANPYKYPWRHDQEVGLIKRRFEREGSQ